MPEKRKKALIFILIYGLIFILGFKSGEISNRIKNKLKLEQIPVSTQTNRIFYVTEKLDFGTYKETRFYELGENDILIKMFMNKTTRPLLKKRDLEIYDTKGERLY